MSNRRSITGDTPRPRSRFLLDYLQFNLNRNASLQREISQSNKDRNIAVFINGSDLLANAYIPSLVIHVKTPLTSIVICNDHAVSR